MAKYFVTFRQVELLGVTVESDEELTEDEVYDEARDLLGSDDPESLDLDVQLVDIKKLEED
jgi:hypothetical protein